MGKIMASSHKSRFWGIVSVGGLLLACLSLILLIVPGPGVRFGLWPWSTAVDLMYWAFYAGCGAGALGLVGLLCAIGRRQRVAAARFAISALICSGVAGSLYMMRADAGSYVPIHDVTTDLIDPPRFVVIPPRVYDPYIVPDRGRADLMDLEPMARWRIYHKEAYGDIVPLYLPLNVADALKSSEAVIRDLGWTIADINADQGRIEATAQTFWFGFRDDVVIRIREDEKGARIDVRSRSRIGVGDVGANAKRVRTFLALIKEKAQA